MGCGPSTASSTSEVVAPNADRGKAKPPLPPQQLAPQQEPLKAPALTAVQKESSSTVTSGTETNASTSRFCRTTASAPALAFVSWLNWSGIPESPFPLTFAGR